MSYGAAMSVILAGAGLATATPSRATASTAQRLWSGSTTSGPTALSLPVPATANIWGAGHTIVPDPGGSGGGTLPPVVALRPGTVQIQVTASGSITCCDTAGSPLSGPGGAGGTSDISAPGSGISPYLGPSFALVGVFLGPGIPSGAGPPAFSNPSPSVQVVSPQLEQVFYVGTGATPSGKLRTFMAPRGATRLFLGLPDAAGFNGLAGYYYDNSGSLTVKVSASTLSTAPTITSVQVANGSVTVSWRPAINGSNSDVTAYTVTAAPAGNNRVPKPVSQAVSVSVPGNETTARLSGLLADCHQVYSLTVTPVVGGSAQASSIWPVDVRPSGVVSATPPRQVVVIIDGISESERGFSMNPYKPTLNGTPSYCPQAWVPTHHTWNESNFAGAPRGPWGPFNKWNFNQVGDSSHSSDSTPRNLADRHLGTPTNLFMLDSIAAEGAVILPYSYEGAYLRPARRPGQDPTFTFATYTRCNSSPQSFGPFGFGCNNFNTKNGNHNGSINQDVAALNNELASIHRVWPGASITVLGHSQGGLIALDWWSRAARHERGFSSDGVTHLFSLDSPVNGACYAITCSNVAGYPRYPRSLTQQDPKLLALDNATGDQMRLIGTEGDTVPMPGGGAYGPPGPENLLHQLLLSHCKMKSGSPKSCSISVPPDHVSTCPITSKSPQWVQNDQHFITKFCPGNVAYFDAVLGLPLG